MNFMIEIKVTATTILKRFKSKFISSSFYMYWNICLMKTRFQGQNMINKFDQLL